MRFAKFLAQLTSLSIQLTFVKPKCCSPIHSEIHTDCHLCKNLFDQNVEKVILLHMIQLQDRKESVGSIGLHNSLVYLLGSVMLNK